MSVRYRSSELASVSVFGRVSDLLWQHADPNSYDNRGKSALHIACSQGFISIAFELILFGADIEGVTRDRMRQRPLHIACDRLASHPKAGELVALLLEVGADPTARRTGGQKPSDLISPQSGLSRILESYVTRWTIDGPNQFHKRTSRSALVSAVSHP